MDIPPNYSLALLAALTLATSSAQAEFFQCKNADGKSAFTDNITNCVNRASAKQLSEAKPDEFHNEIPDLLQTLNKANFAGDGKKFCGPVAVSNSFAWLEQNTNEEYQINLVKKLSSPAYMNTVMTNGTSVMGLIQGVDKYATEHWGGYKTLSYRGPHKISSKFYGNVDYPTLEWMTSALHRKGSLWLNIGWYTQQAGDYQRTGGHWVTLVGYEKGKLVIHDPATSSNKYAKNQLLSINLLMSGKLIDGNHTANACNHYLITDGLKISSKETIAIVDGAVKFELN